MYVLGVTGPIGHGKSTLANALMDLEHPSVHMETSILISRVANEWLPNIPRTLLLNKTDFDALNLWTDNLSEIVSRQLRKVNPSALRITQANIDKEPRYTEKLFAYLDYIRQGVVGFGETITEENKDRHRAILQWLGGFLVYRVDKGIWFEEIESLIQKAEADGVRLYVVGGVRYKYDAQVLRRNGGIIIKLVRADLPEREVNDITEQERNQIRADTTFISDASPRALNEVSHAFFHDLLLNDLSSEYNSKDYQAMVD